MKIFRLSSRMLLLFVVIIASFLAAFIGQIVVNNLQQGPSLVRDQGFIIRPSDDPFLQLQGLEDKISDQQKSLVSIYQQIGNRLEEQAQGVIVTSDGWIIAPNTSEGVPVWTHIRLADGELQKVADVRVDESLGVVFLSIDKADLQPVTFAESFETALFTPYPLVSLGEVAIAYITSELVDSELYLSSDQQNRAKVLSHGRTGDLLLNEKAEMLGMVMMNEKPKLISSEQLASKLRLLLKEGALTTPGLNLRYIDLSQQALLETFSKGLTKGALLSNALLDSETVTTALPRSSNAFEAGVRLGDIIVAVDGRELTSDYSLSDALVSKELGDTVELSILRTQNELSIEVELE